MKPHFITLALMALCLTQLSCKGNSQPVDNETYLKYNGNYHEEIIKPEATAWKRVAKAVYNIGQDDATQWAAEKADSLCDVLIEKGNSLCNGEQTARLYEVQNLIAFKLSYIPAMMGGTAHPDEFESAMGIPQNTEKMINSLKNDAFRNAIGLIEFEHYTYSNFWNLFELLGQGTAIKDARDWKEQAAITRNTIKDTIQAYRYTSALNNSTFFLTYFPCMLLLNQNPSIKEHLEELIGIGEWFDKQSANTIEAVGKVENGNPLPNMSLEEYTAMAKQASQYRVRIIELLAESLTLPAE